VTEENAITFPFKFRPPPTNFCPASTTSSTTKTPAYLDAMTSAAIATPPHKLYESPNSRSVELSSSGWFITASTNPISNTSELDALHESLGIPLPEMTFGNNYLTLEHRTSGWKYTFNTEEALRGVKNGELEDGDGGVKVGYADAWLKSR